MRKLFYAFILVGIVGCGQSVVELPEDFRIYKSVYEEKYCFDGAYGAEEVKPFDGMLGEVKQLIYHLDNNGEKTVLFHQNGLIDEIITKTFDEETRTDKTDNIKYIYKYKNDVFYRTILKNKSKIQEDTTYYRNGLPLLRESSAGTEKWEFDHKGRLIKYHRNDTLLFERKYYIESAFEGSFVEEHTYDGRHHSKIINYNVQGQISNVEYYDSDTGKYLYKDTYNYYYDGRYDIVSADDDMEYGTKVYDKFGNFLGDRYGADQYAYDLVGNWIKHIHDSWDSGYHFEEVRDIVYFEQN